MGLITGAISLIADAIHTLSDMITSLIVIWGFKQADKPADTKHPYGHGRAEYVATLIISVLLCVAGIEFIEVSIDRIKNPIISDPEWWMVGLIFFTILIKEFFFFECFIKDFKLLPLPLIKTAIFLLPGYFST